MSYFGKKSLKYWDWEIESLPIESVKRWNNTSKPFQLELLKKWYPIGMKGFILPVIYGDMYECEIVDYIEYQYGYGIKTNLINHETTRPFRFMPKKEEQTRILRELRLDNLLD